MMISIKQTASNIAQEFELYADGHFIYSGRLGTFSRRQQIALCSNYSPVLTGKYQLPQWRGDDSFGNWPGLPDWTKRCAVFSAEKLEATIFFVHHGLFQGYYEIFLEEGTDLQCFSISKGDFTYLPVFQDGRQIALTELYLTTVDLKYQYKLYLLDEFAHLKPILSFFVLYYANWNMTSRFHMSKGTVITKAYSVSVFNDKFDPQWRERHFPKENFFS